jgi:TolA-binding protein
VTYIAEHPEDLLDRALRGETSSEENRKLKEHVDGCPACASHLKAGPGWARSTDPVRDDDAMDRRAAGLVMAKLGRPAAPRRIRYVWGLAAAALLFAGVAGAEYARHYGLPSMHLWASSPPVQPAVESAPPHAERPAIAPTAAVENTPPEMTELAPRAEPSPVAIVSAAPVETPAQLFSEANDLRRNGKEAQSVPLYRKLQRSYPGSAEAEVSYATLGSLLLERGRAQEALTQFDHYIEHGGALLEDVLAGKASALSRLGRARDERRTWEGLLSRFPSSVYAARARARLAELQ